MRIFYLLMILVCVSVPVFAQQITVEAMCEQISAQGDANYEPGIDVNGNPVVSADVGESIKAINYPLVVPIELDILKFLEVDYSESLDDAEDLEVDAAYLSLFEDGRIEYNGRDISDSAEYICVENFDPTVQPESAIEPEAAPVEETTIKKDDTPPLEPVESGTDENADFETLMNKVTTDESAPEEPEAEPKSEQAE